MAYMVGVVLGLMLFCNSCSTIPISNDTIPSKSHLVLPAINIKGNAMVAKRRGDTLIFAADRYKSADAIRLEQLLSNVPGFQVDANGRISFNGKPIQKLMLDGDDLTAENYQLISRNLRSLLIDSIQVLEKYNGNRLLKNVKNNHGIAMNLILKPNYYGKLNMTLISAYAPKKSGEVQSELIHLLKRRKQFILVNANNLGTYPLQNQLIEQSEQVKQEVLFHSWPLELQNNIVGSLANRYINQNGDWGVAFASTSKANEYTQVRLNLKKSNQYLINRIEQNQLFSYSDDLSIRVYSVSASRLQYNTTSGSIDIERDKGDKNSTKYQLKFYNELSKMYACEERRMNVLTRIHSTSILYSKGIKFSVFQSWASKPNKVWLWEADVEGSTNRFNFLAERDNFMYHDSLKNILNRFFNHSGANIRTGIGYFKKTGAININFWLKSSLSTLNSKQYLQQLNLNALKNYFSAHITKSISKKINVEIQSMIGVVDYRINVNRQNKVIYHLDYAVLWKRKATQQLSFNYGVLRQEGELRKFYAGEVYFNGSTLMKGPSDLAFPVSVYSQLNFSTMDLYRGLTFVGQFMIKRVLGGYFMSIEVDPFYTRITELNNGMESQRSLNLHFEKIIHPLRLKYRIQSNTMYVNSLSKFNKEQFYTINQIYRVGNNLSSNWRKGYNIQVEYQYVRANFNGLNAKSDVWSTRHEFKSTLQLQFSRQLNTSLILLRYSGKDIKAVDLLDYSMNWMINSKYRFYIQGFNLLNKKYFIEQILRTNIISTSIQQLIGRRIILGLDLPL